ncbi:MAG: hypothetical protein ACYTF7_11065 [Planctomycetota bacterium]|jgi:hypothetical protein
MAHKQLVRLTLVAKNAFAFNRLLKEGEFLDREVVVFEESEMAEDEDGNLVNPPGYEGKERGFKNVPCPGSWRIRALDAPREEAAVELDTFQDTADFSEVSNAIIVALPQLDVDDDRHWTAEGLPRTDIVSEIAGVRVTRQEIDSAQPGFSREAAQG